MSNENLPSYLAAAKPNPTSNRAAWFKNTAPAYAGVMLWFVFWQDIPKEAALSYGLALPVLAVMVAALLSFGLFYWVPGMLGMKTGLPLYVVGSSLFGTRGGIAMPGLFMGLLQFGWVAVNVYFSSKLISQTIPIDPRIIMVIWGALATLVGLKGIKYVAPISSFLPIIPVVILVWLIIKTFAGVGDFVPEMISAAPVENAVAAALDTASSAPSQFAVFGAIVAYIIGFFATAGAAGVDFGSNARNSRDVFCGGFVGVALTMIGTGIAALLIVAGAYGTPAIASTLATLGAPTVVTDTMTAILGQGAGKTAMFLLALAAFPSACFSALIAANSFKAMLPNVNSNVSVAIGGAVAILIAVTGLAANAGTVFNFIGASFGPICGAMFVEYFMNGQKWSGPREGFNAAGWISWALGFIVGTTNFFVPGVIPISPLAAFVVGAVVYFVCVKAGLQSKPAEFER